MVLVFFSFLIYCQVSFYGQLTYEKRLSGIWINKSVIFPAPQIGFGWGTHCIAGSGHWFSPFGEPPLRDGCYHLDLVVGFVSRSDWPHTQTVGWQNEKGFPDVEKITTPTLIRVCADPTKIEQN